MSTTARAWSHRATVAATIRTGTLVAAWSGLTWGWLVGNHDVPVVVLIAINITVVASGIAAACDWVASRALWEQIEADTQRLTREGRGTS